MFGQSVRRFAARRAPRVPVGLPGRRASPIGQQRLRMQNRDRFMLNVREETRDGARPEAPRPEAPRRSPPGEGAPALAGSSRRIRHGALRRFIRWRGWFLPGALAGDADLALSARPDGPLAAAVGTCVVGSVPGWGDDPLPKGHCILVASILRDSVLAFGPSLYPFHNAVRNPYKGSETVTGALRRGSASPEEVILCCDSSSPSGPHVPRTSPAMAIGISALTGYSPFLNSEIGTWRSAR
jgi:hypothetical protein